MYNIRDDISEQNELGDDYPERRARMKGELDEWLSEMPPPALSREVPMERAKIFYGHYLEKRTDVNLNRLYRDWDHGLSPDQIANGVRQKLLDEKK